MGTATWSPKKPKGPGHARRVSGNTSTDSAGATSPGNASSSRTVAVPTSPLNIFNTAGDGTPAKGASRASGSGSGLGISGPSPYHTPSTSAPSGLGLSGLSGFSGLSGLATTPPAGMGSGALDQYYQKHLQQLHAQASGEGQSPGQSQGKAPRIRYREQGVDELLQLKLHQALAATDDVPEGATIVLATGDGNVGQFNEDGFLGRSPLFLGHCFWSSLVLVLLFSGVVVFVRGVGVVSWGGPSFCFGAARLRIGPFAFVFWGF